MPVPLKTEWYSPPRMSSTARRALSWSRRIWRRISRGSTAEGFLGGGLPCHCIAWGSPVVAGRLPLGRGGVGKLQTGRHEQRSQLEGPQRHRGGGARPQAEVDAQRGGLEHHRLEGQFALVDRVQGRLDFGEVKRLLPAGEPLEGEQAVGAA